MRNRVKRSLLPVLGSILISATSAGPAAAAETTPPQLDLLPFAAFNQGGVIGSSAAPTDTLTFTDSIPMYVTWRGRDASGLCGYDVLAQYAGREPSVLVSGTMRTRYDGTMTDYDDQYGGGSQKVDGWQVVAHDCAGNSTAKYASARPTVTQEDGHSNGYETATVNYTGAWSRSSCSCWSAGAVRRTTQKGSIARITYDSFRANGTVGIVMEKAPNRGKFTLRVDGVSRGTIDTYASVPTHRVIVWQGRFPKAGRHVIELVNQATPGRPRIDLDAVLLNT